MAELTEETPEIPVDSMFHPDNVQQYILLTLLQIKEYLAVVAGNINESHTETVEDYHEKGKLVYPAPYLAVDEDAARDEQKED